MREHKKPDWERLDSLRSLKDVAVIGGLALAECIKDSAAWLDSHFADKINGEED